ncbi:putative transcriptional regulatory protein YeeN [bioreactor metagenome]|uniref:Putative transcriptional regulatory protein YeeN n=1 Tax=bioreactor metagenome TaxID=1076179 RepID=A0A645DY43_9ZZZZ|nr:YebC/PmpR family DNA-binding transcriptional regulator [Erysipelotrichaceae bacterium]
MGRAHEVRKAAMEKTAAAKAKVYSRYGKEIYIAAKSGVPDPDMNVSLKRMIEKARANQVPTEVIKRAIEKAKGGSNESYDSMRYEGFGPNGSTFIVECLTDNVNRTYTEVRNCFNKAKFNIGVKGSVAHLYDHLGILSVAYDNEETMLETLINADVNVNDLESEDGMITVYVEPTELYKAKDAIDSLIPDAKFEVLEISMLPQSYVDLDDEDYQMFERFTNLIDQIDDVQQLYHNVNSK